MIPIVLIPTVTERKQDDVMLEISIHKQLPSTVKMASNSVCAEPMLYPLKQSGFYSEGYIALEMLRSLINNKVVNFKLPEKIELHCSGRGLGGSAELALAIRKIFHFHTESQIVCIATGILYKDYKDDVIYIKQIDKLQDKLKFILDEKLNNNWKDKKVFLFIPKLNSKNKLLIETINQIKNDNIGTVIYVLEVTTLVEVIEKLHEIQSVIHPFPIAPSKNEISIFGIMLIILIIYVFYVNYDNVNDNQTVFIENTKYNPIELNSIKKVMENSIKIEMGKLFYNIIQQQNDIMELRENAKSGNINSQFKMGILSLKGFNRNGIVLVEQDNTQAADWFEHAANKGHPRSKYYLGLLYLNGTGRTKNIEKAKQLFHESSRYLQDARYAFDSLNKNNTHKSFVGMVLDKLKN